MQAEKPIRRSQLISPWGVGQMINFPKDESLMVAGLDMWELKFRELERSHTLDEFIVEEERLAKRLRVKNFRLPPDFRDNPHERINQKLKIPFVRFPRWHYCTRCGYMHKVPIFHSERPKCLGLPFQGQSCSTIAERKRRKLIPVRFITICSEGHIEDFPFEEWVHNGSKCSTTNPIMRLRAGRSSGALSGIEILCSCGEKKSMAGAFNENALSRIDVNCSAGRPWLGEEKERNNTRNCNHPLLKVVQKGASNVYFSNVRSSIYLPQWQPSVDSELIDILEKNWGSLNSGRVNGEFDRKRFYWVAASKLKVEFEQIDFWVDKLIDAAQKKIIGYDSMPATDSEEFYRKMEYDAILREPGSEKQDFYVSKVNIAEYTENEIISKSFDSICLLHKLRETRAFTGFSRWLYEDGKALEAKKDFIKLGASINWLPAIVVRGEGVFFKFNENSLKEWAAKKEVIERVKGLAKNFNKTKIDNGQIAKNITPEFILIHTFAHLVINQFSYECGYGSSALRERIYCNLEFPDEVMNGVLIYTASGDSEGSLGGLVRQGKPGNLETIIYNSIENARWCSSDPICIDTRGQGPNSCNLAACHNCALLPETCCEESNMLLDRAMLIGTLDNPEIGFFNFE
ncbi:MAG TPA: hypothetical protein DCQ58_10090 [Saprospirales bacterium]|nr:hypothetical protein [Saprospirales bacterium]HRK00823.1 DUF1998 domain-containing protein [Ignavibacteria bacterium]